MKKIDTAIHHVSKPGANLFLELGFPPDEAKRLHRASQQQINDTRLLKEQLMTEPPFPGLRADESIGRYVADNEI